MGPWVWYGRDFDPTLPASTDLDGSNVCLIGKDPSAGWAALPAPDLHVVATSREWIAKTDDLPTASQMFGCRDPQGHEWVMLHRYASWHREDARLKGISKRERDIFFLQFSWLLPRGQGDELMRLLEQERLVGRWMPELHRPHQQYLGESAGTPIVDQAKEDLEELSGFERLSAAGLQAWPAIEQYLWEGNTLDCSLDESVNLYVPSAKLLADGSWVGHRAEWSVNDQVVCRSVEVTDDATEQYALLADRQWLQTRLQKLDVDLVIGTLIERHAHPEDDGQRPRAYSDVQYLALHSADGYANLLGPQLTVHE